MSIPTVITYDYTQAIGSWVPASSLVYGYDIDGIAYWNLWDTYDTGAWIWANGGWQWPSTLVTTTDLGSAYFGGAIDYGTEQIWAQAVDWFGNASAWTPLLLYQSGVSVGTTDFTQLQGTWTSATNVVSGTNVATWQFYDSNWTGAWIWADGDWHYPETVVTTSNLNGVWIGGAVNSASEVIWVRGADAAGNWSEWTDMFVSQFVPQQPEPAALAEPPPEIWVAGAEAHAPLDVFLT